MNIYRFDAIVRASQHLVTWLDEALTGANQQKKLQLTHILTEIHHANQWFTPEYVQFALSQICQTLKEVDIHQEQLKSFYCTKPHRIAIIMAGNIPAVGFLDLLHTLITGNIAICKLSSNDKILIPFLIEIMKDELPQLNEAVFFSDDIIKNFDAVIASGSNNAARYFNYYFSKYPHIIRKNRNSIAILTGNESHEELQKLADDVFIYFGLGCRNVSALFVPEMYDFEPLITAFQKYHHISYHHKYMNNYDYYRAVFLLNYIPFYDGGFFLLTQHKSIQSPPAVIYYQHYQTVHQIKNFIHQHQNDIQCVVSFLPEISSIPAGTTQRTGLFDFADGINTLEFLKSLDNVLS